jgi:hypothetical protein
MIESKTETKCVYKRIAKDGSISFQAKVRHPASGKFVSRTFSSLAEATKWKNSFRSHILNPNPIKTKGSHGLTPQEAREIRLTKGKCDICGEEEKDIEFNFRRGEIQIKTIKSSLAIDHCHLTGKIRGVLCHSCNKSLGGFKDDKHLLQAAIAYLDSFGPKRRSRSLKRYADD